MASDCLVPIFYLDQDSSWMDPCRIVSRGEARRLKQIGAGSFIDHGRAFRLKDPAPPPPMSFLAGPLETSSTITLAEIEANVGITTGEPGTPADAGLVSRAQSKIRAYPHIFDELATLAHNSRIQSPVPITVTA